MRRKTTNLLFLLLTLIYSQTSLGQEWNSEKRDNHVAARQDSSSWDLELYAEDQQVSALGQKFGCINYGAFPTPDYDLIDKNSFGGLSSLSTCYQPYLLNKKNAVFTSFGYSDNPYYAEKLNGKEDVSFFTLITVTDTLDMERYETARNQIISRNHPDYIGQGFIKNKTSQIDFIAFTTPEGSDFAIVNTRIFHLDQGRFIVIAPHKDGSFRSLQLNEKPRSMSEIKDFVEGELLNREHIKSFLTNEKTI